MKLAIAFLLAVGLLLGQEQPKVVVHAFEAPRCPMSKAVSPLREALESKYPGVKWLLHPSPMYLGQGMMDIVKPSLPLILKYKVRHLPYYLVEVDGTLIFRGMMFEIPPNPKGGIKEEIPSFVERMKREGRKIPNLLEAAVRAGLEGRKPAIYRVEERGCGIPGPYQAPLGPDEVP